MEQKERYTFEELKEIIARPQAEGGGPWDSTQTHESIKSVFRMNV